MNRKVLKLLLAQLTWTITIEANPVDPDGDTRRTSIAWEPCQPINGPASLSCANLTVPRDYTDPDAGTHILPIYKMDALKQPSKGSILVNFGGPGNVGLHTLAVSGEQYQYLTGGRHDLVLVEPRGTGSDSFTCYDSIQDAMAIFQGPYSTRDYHRAVDDMVSHAGGFAETCYNKSREHGSLIGTAFVARDMMNVVDALQEDGLLRYYGLSYGTYLGAVLAAMFPKRVDKMALDGVLNVFEYRENKDVELVSDVDNLLDAFFADCVTARDICPLAGDLEADELKVEVLKFLDEIRKEPVVIDSHEITWNHVRADMLVRLYDPTEWHLHALFLHGIMTGDLTLYEKAFAEQDPPIILEPGTEFTFESSWGIRCADQTHRPRDVDEMQVYVDERLNRSILGDYPDKALITCAQWKIDSKEKYKGNFRTKTKNPVLLVGNMDPVTPFVSAQNLSNVMEKSVVLRHGGKGHGSLAEVSACTFKAFGDYFNKGKLPKKGSVCDVHIPPLPKSNGWELIEKQVKKHVLGRKGH